MTETTLTLPMAPPPQKSHTIYKTADGVRVPGVTTILGVINKPQLVAWANDMGLKGINTRTYVDDLAQVGTLTHYLIMCDLLQQSPDVRSFSQDLQDRAAQAMASWYAWRRVHTIEPILLETPLVSEEYRYGGTLDLYAVIDGVETLGDIKTAKAVYSEHSTQVVGYRQLLLEKGHTPKDFRIIRVGREPGEGFEERPVDNIQTRWQIFRCCLELYNLQKEVK